MGRKGGWVVRKKGIEGGREEGRVGDGWMGRK